MDYKRKMSALPFIAVVTGAFLEIRLIFGIFYAGALRLFNSFLRLTSTFFFFFFLIIIFKQGAHISKEFLNGALQSIQIMKLRYTSTITIYKLHSRYKLPDVEPLLETSKSRLYFSGACLHSFLLFCFAIPNCCNEYINSYYNKNERSGFCRVIPTTE